MNDPRKHDDSAADRPEDPAPRVELLRLSRGEAGLAEAVVVRTIDADGLSVEFAGPLPVGELCRARLTLPDGASTEWYVRVTGCWPSAPGTYLAALEFVSVL